MKGIVYRFISRKEKKKLQTKDKTIANEDEENLAIQHVCSVSRTN